MPCENKESLIQNIYQQTHTNTGKQNIDRRNGLSIYNVGMRQSTIPDYGGTPPFPSGLHSHYDTTADNKQYSTGTIEALLIILCQVRFHSHDNTTAGKRHHEGTSLGQVRVSKTGEIRHG